MPDISMCNGLNCPLRETCYRHIATPSYRQSYFMTAPIKEDKTCDYYWKAEEKDIKKLDYLNDENTII